MPGYLDGKTAIVTGAAVGIGNAFAKALAAEGANVAVCDVRPEITEVAKELEAIGPGAAAFVADVSKPDDVRRVVDGTVERFGRIDVLVSNAGTWRGSTATDDLDKTLDDYESVVGTNLKGVYLFGRAVIPQMIAQGGGGEIVNISTDHVCTCGSPYERTHDDAPDCPWAGQGPRPTGGGPGMDLYDASKWGINGFTIPWSKALKEHRIRVNALCMGATDSHMLRGFHSGNLPPESKLWMKPEDVARLMIDLITEGPEGRTGNNINIAMGHPIELPAPGSPYIYQGA